MRRYLTLTDTKLGYLLALPTILWSALVLGYPLISTIGLSFTDQRVIGGPAPWVGLDNYAKVLQDPEVTDAFLTSLKWVAGNFILNNLTALVVALAVWQRIKGHALVEALILVPWIIPQVITAIMFRYILNPSLGVLDYLLMSTGFVREPLQFLASPQQSMQTVVGINVWINFGFRALLILAALIAIPEEQFDAAKVDGAGAWRRFVHIILPAIMPVLAVVLLLGAFMAFNDVEIIWLFTQGGPGSSTTTLPILVYQKAYLTQRTAEAATLSVLMAGVLVIVAAAYFRMTREEYTR